MWAYLYKFHKQQYKAQGACDGSTQGGQVIVSGLTYTATPESTDFRIAVALCVIWEFLLFEFNVSNVFAETPPPKQQYYMRIDNVFMDWWATCHPNLPITKNHAVPVEQNLQGNPEGPQQWAIHIDNILLDNMKFVAMAHALCLYIGTILGHKLIILY